METRIVMQQKLTAAHSDDEHLKLGLVVLNMVIMPGASTVNIYDSFVQ
jgi:hypothetical protein